MEDMGVSKTSGGNLRPGSTPGSGTIFALVAQLAERSFRTREVAGSVPAEGSIRYNCCDGVSPSGKARVFGIRIPRFESGRPNQTLQLP